MENVKKLIEETLQEWDAVCDAWIEGVAQAIEDLQSEAKVRDIFPHLNTGE